MRELLAWGERGYSAPSPPFVKRNVLSRHAISGGIWIETGTFLGDTTEFLAKNSHFVYSIEPSPDLYERACKRFLNFENVKLINGLSEDVLPNILSNVSGDVCFWLDGHFSHGITFQGERDTPIREELSAIRSAISALDRIAVCIDDVRCFDPLIPDFESYPPIGFLVAWAEESGLKWSIEHDIFVAKNFTV